MTSHTYDLRARLDASFKAYDIRGRVPEELDADVAYSIGRAFSELFSPRKVVIGRDVRLSSYDLAMNLSRGLADGGVDVYDIALCGTEEVYFATFSQAMDGGIMVTASHNPANYNGMKMVRGDAKPISGDSGLRELQTLIAVGTQWKSSNNGKIYALDIRQEYVKHLLGYVDLSTLRPLRIVTNAGNGCAGLVIDALEHYLPFEFIKIQHKPNGTFPVGVPNPLLPQNRVVTTQAVCFHGADMGIAWDGDFDRCFFFDEQGQFVEGYYLVSILASIFLRKHPGERIIHDPRLTWNTIKVVSDAGGIPVQSKTGHAFIKERMRNEDAIYGGEMSAHHYFRDFHYCDSGMIPWLLIAELISRTGKKLSELVSAQQQAFPVSGEINMKVSDPDTVLALVEAEYKHSSKIVDFTDGLSIEYSDWRFNLRKSNTEPVLRLNVETRQDGALMQRKTKELLAFISNINSR